ncbi:MAG: HAD family hydrolase [Desulfobulbaceae bacterium]|nr:HAD family hydrolase [Desulfobulbaceae bacterium]
MRYKAILFDLDGTLLDTLEDLATAANRALGTLGLPAHPTDAYRVFVGDGLRTLAERILPGEQRSAAQVDALVVAFEREYSRTWNERTAPYAGVPEMLDRLTGDGYRMSVLSNKPDAFTRLCVEQLLPHWTFAPLYGQRPGVPRKPDPAAALAIAVELGLDPAEVLYLGDTATDMHTARAAGMAAVGVLWGFRTADELRAAGARHLITHPGELAPLLHPSSAPRS